MYKQDIPTAKVLQKIQEKYNYPRLIGASAGKNMPKRTIEVTNIIKGWTTGASIQSTDKEVLNSINRSNISIPYFVPKSPLCIELMVNFDFISPVYRLTIKVHSEKLSAGLFIFLLKGSYS